MKKFFLGYFLVTAAGLFYYGWQGIRTNIPADAEGGIVFIGFGIMCLLSAYLCARLPAEGIRKSLKGTGIFVWMYVAVFIASQFLFTTEIYKRLVRPHILPVMAAIVALLCIPIIWELLRKRKNRRE